VRGPHKRSARQQVRCIFFTQTIYVRAEVPLPLFQHTPGPVFVQCMGIHMGRWGRTRPSVSIFSTIILHKIIPQILLNDRRPRVTMLGNDNFYGGRSMIDIRALETFQKFAGWLEIIFFPAAYFYYCGMLDERYLPSAERIADYYNNDLLYWLLANEFLPIQVAGWAFFLGISILSCMVILFCFEKEILNRLEYRLPGFPYTLTGTVCLLAGVLFIVSLLIGSPISSFNPLWYLGLLCYGLDLLDTAARLRGIFFP
jgi:hypothetical protein